MQKHLDRPVRILLVEDNPGHATLAERSLRKVFPRLDWMHIKDGETALDYLLRRKDPLPLPTTPLPDVILLDLRLPRVDGLEVLRTIKAHPRLATIPVVVISTSQMQTEIDEVMAQGVDFYVVKPYRFLEFADRIRNLLAGNASRKPLRLDTLPSPASE